MSFYFFRSLRDEVLGTQVYTTFLDLGMVRDKIILPDEGLADRLFKDPSTEMQRKLNWGRVRAGLVPYLRQKKVPPFFSALTVVVVPADFGPLKEGVHYAL